VLPGGKSAELDPNPKLLKKREIINFVLIEPERFDTVEFHLFGLIGTASHPDVQKIRIIGFFFENGLHWRFEFRLLIFTACTCV
jgi:hypothetical protein